MLKRRNKFERNQLTRVQREIVEKLAKEGFKHYSILYDATLGVATDAAVWKALKFLTERRLIELKGEEPAHGRHGERGRARKLYGLAFRGLHYGLQQGFIQYEDVKDLIKRHNIIMPSPSKTEHEDMVRKAPPQFRPAFLALAIDGFKGVTKFMVENHPKKFFDNFAINPITASHKNYAPQILIKAFFMLQQEDDLMSDGTFIDLLGEDSFLILKGTAKQLDSYGTALSSLSPEQRKKMLAKLKKFE